MPGNAWTGLRERLARVEPHLATRRTAALLFGLALAAYWIQARAWPFQRGRDAWDYFAYYLSLADGDPAFPLVMLVRTPIAPLVLGAPMQLGGALALEIALSVLYAVSIVAWAAAARRFSPFASALVAAAMLLAAGYAGMFHEAGSEAVTATLFALWALAVVRAAFRPTTAAFALVGAGIAALALTRPANQVLLAAVALPLLAPAGWATRARWVAVAAAAAVLPLALWAGVNGLRYGDVTVSRLGDAAVPFFRPFVSGRVDPDNGPASQRLASAVEREVLPLPAYRRLGVDAETYLRGGTNFEAIRLFGLADLVDGRGSSYRLLRDAAREVPGDGLVVAGIDVSETVDAMRAFLTQDAPHEDRRKPEAWPEPPTTRTVDGRLLPDPRSLPPPRPAVEWGFISCASDEIDRCILADPTTAYADPGERAAYRRVTDRVRAWDADLGVGASDAWVAAQLQRLTHRAPGAWLWLVVAVAAVAVRRPRGWPALAALCGLALLVLLVHAAGVGAIPYYGAPVLPAFVLAAACGLVGRRAAPARP